MTYRESSEELDLQQYLAIVRRRWLPAAAVFSASVGLAALFTFLQEPIYESKGTLRVKPDTFEGLSGLPSLSNELSPLGRQSNPLETEALVLRSRELAKEVIQSLSLQDENGEPMTAAAFAGSLKVVNVSGTDVLQITFLSEDREEAAKVVNELMDLYIDQTIQNNRLEARAAVAFISQELPQVESEVLAAEAAVRTFKERNQIVDLQEESETAVTVEANLNRQIVNTRSALEEAETSVEALRQQVSRVSGDEAVVTES
ncbi:MAG: Wzz/FepE/Etk N-terminal domain-containing protein, partial [Cyanobacteria bacterium J06639_1]